MPSVYAGENVSLWEGMEARDGFGNDREYACHAWAYNAWAHDCNLTKDLPWTVRHV